MIELPRAALVADQIAGAPTSQLRYQQPRPGPASASAVTTRERLPDAVHHLDEVLPKNPFKSIEHDGVGQLVKIGVEKGRSGKADSSAVSVASTVVIRTPSSSSRAPASTTLAEPGCRVPIARFAAAKAAMGSRVKRQVM